MSDAAQKCKPLVLRILHMLWNEKESCKPSCFVMVGDFSGPWQGGKPTLSYSKEIASLVCMIVLIGQHAANSEWCLLAALVQVDISGMQNHRSGSWKAMHEEKIPTDRDRKVLRRYSNRSS